LRRVFKKFPQLKICTADLGFRGFQYLRSDRSSAINRMTSTSTKSIAIVGGGPVGALAALYFAKHFQKVTLYELRAGPSFPFNVNNRPDDSR